MNIPEGYRLVPVLPTDKMKKAYQDGSLAPISCLSRYGYEAMIEAAPVVLQNSYDEAKERELFIAEFKLEGKICYDENTKQWLPTSDTIKGFQMAERTLGCWIGWSSSAKSRARSAE